MHRKAAAWKAFKIQPADSNYFVFTDDPLQDQTGFVQVIEVFEVGGATPPNQHAVADEVF